MITESEVQDIVVIVHSNLNERLIQVINGYAAEYGLSCQVFRIYEFRDLNVCWGYVADNISRIKSITLEEDIAKWNSIEILLFLRSHVIMAEICVNILTHQNWDMLRSSAFYLAGANHVLEKNDVKSIWVLLIEGAQSELSSRVREQRLNVSRALCAARAAGQSFLCLDGVSGLLGSSGHPEIRDLTVDNMRGAEIFLTGLVRDDDKATLAAWRRYNRLADRQITVTAFGIQFQIYLEGVLAETLLKTGTYENEETELFGSVISNGMTIMDVGANTGYYTILASKLSSSGQVFAFEPAPHTATLLRRNIHLNTLKNVTLVQSAVSDCSGKDTFNINEDGQDGWNALGVTFQRANAQHTIEVDVIELDAFWMSSGSPSVGLIKVDVMGAELLVFRGARFLLERELPVVLFKHHPDCYKLFGYKAADVVTYLTDLGYTCRAIGKNGHNMIAQPKRPPFF